MFYAFGVNQYNINNNASDSICDSLHAEVDCVNRLKKMEKITNINLVVFRTNNCGNNLFMSKPCENCLRTINFTLYKKNYKLKSIYYTNNDSTIIKR